MEPQQQEPDLEKSIKEVMQTLPPPIRQYLAQGKYSEVAKNLMTKYALHVDQASILEREIMLLLMGIENPAEFTQALVEEANISQQTINNIIQDVNTQIFIPLQEEMRKGAEILKQMPPRIPTPSSNLPPAPPRSWSATPTAIPRPPQIHAPVPAYTPPQTPPASAQGSGEAKKYFHLENKLPPPSSMQPRPVVSTPQPITNEKLLEDREEPHIEFNTTPKLSVPARTAPPPPNLPGVILPPTVQPKSTPPVQPLSPVSSRPYSVDPYREPIDEK